MSASFSSAPAPDRGHGDQVPAPGPAVVSPRAPRRRHFALWGIPVIVAVLAGGVALYLNTGKAKVGGKGGGAITVPVVAVTLGDVHRTMRVSGTVAAMNFAALLAPRLRGSRSGFNRGGDFGGVGGHGGSPQVAVVVRGGGGPMGDWSLILMKLAPPGARVKTGDEVAEFDPQMQVQRLDDYKDTLVQTDNSIKKMLANLAAAKESQNQTVRAAKASWDQAILDLKTAPIRSRIDAEKYKLAVQEAAENYKELLSQSSLVDESQLAQIRATQLNRNQSDIELKRAESNVQKMTMKAPMDGIVVMNSIVRNGEFGQIREGDEVRPGQQFMQIVDPSAMVLNASVNQVDAEELRIGMKAVIRLDAYPGLQLPGTLVGIGAMSKTSVFRAGYVGEIPVRLRIEHTDLRVIPDLSGSAEIVLDTEKNALIAPRAALFQDNGAPVVFVQGPEGWTRRRVDLGLTNYIAASVRSGVRKGDLIALQRPM